MDKHIEEGVALRKLNFETSLASFSMLKNKFRRIECKAKHAFVERPFWRMLYSLQSP